MGMQQFLQPLLILNSQAASTVFNNDFRPLLQMILMMFRQNQI